MKKRAKGLRGYKDRAKICSGKPEAGAGSACSPELQQATEKSSINEKYQRMNLRTDEELGEGQEW